MKIEIETHVSADADRAWEVWNSPAHIQRWNAASDDWHTPRSAVDLRVGGRLSSRMEAKDGSAGFDFGGVYTRVEPPRLVELRMDDGREVRVEFLDTADGTRVRETFDADTAGSLDLQRRGWQAILDNFARYVEGLAAPGER